MTATKCSLCHKEYLRETAWPLLDSDPTRVLHDNLGESISKLPKHRRWDSPGHVLSMDESSTAKESAHVSSCTACVRSTPSITVDGHETPTTVYCADPCSRSNCIVPFVQCRISQVRVVNTTCL